MKKVRKWCDDRIKKRGRQKKRKKGRGVVKGQRLGLVIAARNLTRVVTNAFG